MNPCKFRVTVDQKLLQNIAQKFLQKIRTILGHNLAWSLPPFLLWRCKGMIIYVRGRVKTKLNSAAPPGNSTRQPIIATPPQTALPNQPSPPSANSAHHHHHHAPFPSRTRRSTAPLLVEHLRIRTSHLLLTSNIRI